MHQRLDLGQGKPLKLAGVAMESNDPENCVGAMATSALACPCLNLMGPRTKQHIDVPHVECTSLECT